MSAAYGTSPVKRYRRTNAELDALDATIFAVAAAEPPCTVRAVFYRCVSAGAVEKSEKGYGVVQRQLLKLRRAGEVPYSWITDGTRWVFRPKTWACAADAVDALGASYRQMLWLDQDVNVEVFSEKDALVGVIQRVCSRWDVPLGVARGYSSESFAWNVAESLDRDRMTYVYQLGDHDPSGVNAWESFCERVEGFAPDADVVFERLAVTPEQIEELALPTRPTKSSDTRSRGFAGASVEVDAIPPQTLRDLVEDAITSHLDQDQLAMTREQEERERADLNLLTGLVR